MPKLILQYIYKKQTAYILSIIAVVFGFSIFFTSVSYASVGQFLTLSPVTSTDAMVGATNTSWRFNVTTTADLAPMDSFRFIFPAAFDLNSASTTVTSTFISGPTLVKQGGPGVWVNYVSASSTWQVVGAVENPIPAGTAMSLIIGGINNPFGAGPFTDLLWRVLAGTSTVDMMFDQPLATPYKFNATSTFSLTSGDQPPSTSTAAVSNVVLADTDTTGYGLDGRDYTVVWAPTSSQPAGYQFTQIYIVSSTANLTTGNLSTICGAAPCQPIMMFPQFNMATATVPQFMQKDSAGASWATSTEYKAWVYTMASSPSITSSVAVSYAAAFDSVADISAPQIDHSPAHGAKSNAAATLYSFVFDDQTNGGQFGNTGDGGAEYFKLYYTSSTWPGSPASVDAVAVSGAGELYSFTIPTSSMTGSVLKYYLVASDRATPTPNVRYLCATPSPISSANCQSNPFTINVAAAGSRTVSGQILSNNNGVQTALGTSVVFAGGYAAQAVITDGSGNYTISNLPNNDAFEFLAVKSGYTKTSRMETIGTTNKTGINLVLNLGSFGFFTGGSGNSNGGQPQVMFSGPPDGMQGVAPSEKIRVGFNQQMDATTINAADATVTSSNVYLYNNLTGSKIAGSVLYCANQAAAGCSALVSMDQNTILFTPTSNLATGTPYLLIINESVKSQSGQIVQGNRTGGGHKINFTTTGNDFSSFVGDWSVQFNQGGQYMPPFVKSITPAPGITAANNTKILLEFDRALDSATIITSNIDLYSNGSAVVGTSLSLDSTEKRFVTISHSNLSAGEYEVRVKGGVKTTGGTPIRPNAGDVAFSSKFNSSGSVDITAPTIYALLPNNSIGVSTDKIFEFGASEQLAADTVNTSNITMSRGSTAVSISTSFDSGKNSIFVSPSAVLVPNTAYAIVMSPSVTDLAGVTMSTSTFVYTTGGVSTSTPTIKEARCDDYTCKVFFTKPMNRDTAADANFASSTINYARWSLTQGGPNKISASTVLTYDAFEKSITIKNVGLTFGGANFSLVIEGVVDSSENLLTSGGSIAGKVEDSKATFGSFGSTGMFGPPVAGFTGGSVGGGEFKPQGFGNFTAAQFALGQADTAFAFNPLASADSNVFQTKFTPGTALLNGDQIVLTFPDGTNITNAALDQQSPFYTDFNQFMTGMVTGTSVSVDSAANKLTITLGVSGSPASNDPITIDLKKITNPAVPKGPQTGGYTLDIKLLRSGVVLSNKTSMPYFIMAGGSNTLVVDVVAGSSTSSPTSGANGTMYVHGGGPSGPMDKQITLTNGDISQVDGSSGSSITYSNLSDGCYSIGTDPFVTLGSNDYFGQMAPEPVCLSGGETKTKWMLLTSASGANTATLTVKMVDSNGDPYNFGGKDIDIFAGGPNKFVVKTLSNVTTAETNGYQLKLNANGHWFVGMGPAMSKSASGGKPASLGVMPPPSVDIVVNNIASTPVLTSAVSVLPPSVSYTNGVVTFTFASANKTISGTVKDGAGTGLANVEVFAHAQGFGSPVFTQTNASGTFSLSVSDYGNYEIGAQSDGMPPTMKNVELKNESGLKVYMEGKDVTSNLILTLNKAAYTISGKVLNGGSNGIAYAPVIAVDANGNSVFGQTSIDGSYTLFVGNGVWNVKAELPPDKTDSCGSFVKAVTVSGASQSSQNITSSNDSCSTLTGSVSVNSSALANTPLFIEEWDNTNNRPLAGGTRKNTATDSTGSYSVKLGNSTYRLGTWDPTYGELSVTTTVSGSGTQDLTVGTLQTITFNFTGGTSAMNAFVELKNAADNNKRITKQLNGLNSAATFSVPTASTYSYFVNVFGIGNYSGTVAANASATINLGSSSDFITVTGTVYVDSSITGKAGALVSFTNATTTVSAVTDDNGEYSIKLKAGSYSVADSLAGYVPVQASSISFTTNTASYDFGGASPDQTSLKTAGYTIEGTINSSLSVAMTTGYVWGTNASGTVVNAQVNTDGSYSLPVTNGVWTIKAVGPLHVETTLSPNVTVAGSSQTSKNITLTAAAAGTNIPTSTTGMVAASSGGSINDSSVSGIKLTAGAGVLDTGSGNVTVNFEKTFTAPDTANYNSLGNATFNITAAGDSTIKNLSGNAEIQLDYSSLLSSLPTSTTESDLKLVYYSPERGDYVPVEGGFTVDTSTNKITGFVNHFTDFMIAYTPSTEGVPSAPTGLTATAASASQINLSWTAVSGATSYTVYRSTDNVSYSSISTPSSNTYNNTSGLSASTLYYYKVTATNAQGEGASSSAASATTLAASVSGGGGSTYIPPVITTSTVATSTIFTTTTIPVVTTTIKTTTTVEEVKNEVVIPVVKVLVVTNPQSKVVITLPSVTAYQPGSTLKFTYKYKNESKKKVTVKIVRQMLDVKGKAVINVSTNKTIKAGATFTGNIKENLSKNLKPGEYTIKVKILGAKNKVLEENSFKFEVEKLKKKYFILSTGISSDSAITFDNKSISKVKTNVTLPINLQVKYNYFNETELNQKVKMVRQLVDKNGKVLDTKTGKWTIKAGKSENQTFVQKLSDQLAVGEYAVRIRAYDQVNNKLLSENSLWFAVELK